MERQRIIEVPCKGIEPVEASAAWIVVAGPEVLESGLIRALAAVEERGEGVGRIRLVSRDAR